MSALALVLDTGVLYAALDENDADHERSVALIPTAEETLVVPSPVLVGRRRALCADSRVAP